MDIRAPIGGLYTLKTFVLVVHKTLQEQVVRPNPANSKAGLYTVNERGGFVRSSFAGRKLDIGV